MLKTKPGGNEVLIFGHWPAYESLDGPLLAGYAGLDGSPVRICPLDLLWCGRAGDPAGVNDLQLQQLASIDPHGYDAGKKIKGKKRHVLVDTQGLLLHAIIHSADVRIAMAACW